MSGRRTYFARQLEHIRSNPNVIAFITNAINIHPGSVSHAHFTNTILKRFGTPRFIRIKRAFRVIMNDSHWFLQSVAVNGVGLTDGSYQCPQVLGYLLRIIENTTKVNDRPCRCQWTTFSLDLRSM